MRVPRIQDDGSFELIVGGAEGLSTDVSQFKLIRGPEREVRMADIRRMAEDTLIWVASESGRVQIPWRTSRLQRAAGIFIASTGLGCAALLTASPLAPLGLVAKSVGGFAALGHLQVRASTTDTEAKKAFLIRLSALLASWC